MTGPAVQDVVAPRPVRGRDVLHRGHVFDLVSDAVELEPGSPVRRDVIDHPGAVAVVVLDDDERVLLQRQYRHPVRRELWEPPAGLLDVVGEDARAAAERELFEEADLRAARWDVLVDYLTTPGASSEAVRVFLARDLSEVPANERHEREDEEKDMPARWVPLDEAADAVLAGHVHNPSAVVGILAAVRSRSLGWSTLRPADAPWPERRSQVMADAAGDLPG
ncbi:ADP-ribose pyrophosphatase [Sediminihabitans luteus]|uniref:ADP-ribose pyrophosphatase n=1 Tax=Sediminihabitans luteus TaxID=1138585 RepID=A0A2M9CRG5_9CELL|nr:NUDIX hydrolase [Sediminihabitans luteus]PJJ74431.1 ADP-ribose pyrophosphatase [Sediminihabitans luteus]GIJ00202.1 NUDIX hydrolase [Sediminihabitans luteus]